MKLLTDKHAPKKPSEITGQGDNLALLHAFVSTYGRQKKKAALLFGPSGTGKTSAAYAVGRQLNLEIVEVNASDFRNAEGINTILGGAMKQQSLFSRGKLILVDEIDGLAGHQDRGGVQAVEKSAFPVILTATNPYDHKLSTLRSKSMMLEFKRIEANSLLLILKKICAQENIPCEEHALATLARRAGGDARAAINNLQEDVDERFLWLDENLPKEYTKAEDLARAYDALSKADVFSRRIRRWQHYRFLVYVNALLSGGIAVAKDGKNPHFVEYKPTGRILKLWWANQKSLRKKAIAKKLAMATHTSQRSALQGTLPYFTILFNKSKEMQPQLAEEFGLEEEEVEWLQKNASVCH